MIAVSHLSGVFWTHHVSGLKPIADIGRIGGVDFFFVLSGFLIYHVYAKYAGDWDRSLRFLKRRLIRIYPLLWFFTLLSLPVYFFVQGVGSGHELNTGVILKSLLLFPGDDQPVLGATWSLSHVVLFYLVFFVFLLSRRFTIGVVALWALLILADGLFELFTYSSASIKILLSAFNLEFLCGCLLAAYLKHRAAHHGHAWIGVGIGLFVLTWLAHETLWNGAKFPLYTGASLALIYGAVAIEKHRRIDLPAALDLLGDAAYAMIVVNLPIIIASAKLLNWAGLLDSSHAIWTVPLTLGFVLAGSIVVHLLIERRLAAVATRAVDQFSLRLGRLRLHKRPDSD